MQDVLSSEETQLYELIRCRALASQMTEACGQNIEMIIEAGKCLFVARNPDLSEKGFLAVYQTGYDPKLLRPCPLDGLKSGQIVQAEQVIPEEIGSSGSGYYTFDTLLDDLADFSIPVEAPLLVLLQEMLDKGYLFFDADGCFHCQQNAAKVISTLNRAFPGMKGINLSAYYEQTVTEAVSGRKSLDFALKQFDQNFIMHGVPQVKIRLPRSVPKRPKRSKNIIKSPEPESVQPLHDKAALREFGSQAASEPEEVKEAVSVAEDLAPQEEVGKDVSQVCESEGVPQLDSEAVSPAEPVVREEDLEARAENDIAEEAPVEKEAVEVQDDTVDEQEFIPPDAQLAALDA